MRVGEVIGGRLRVDRILGVGGFGVVAAATHLELRQEVAVKMLKPELTNDVEMADRFLREARAVAALRTEHVCRVFDVGRTDDGVPYIVMELLTGSDVAALIRREPLPPAIAVDFVMQTLLALGEAHPIGIVHRDLKPPNLFVTRRTDNTSLVKVLDFGIAKAVDELRLTHSSNLLGSPQYMSPEQITTPRDVDARTDIWSVGVTLYHMLARRLPFPSAQIAELCVMITTKPPAPIDIDPGLRAVIWRCLEKDRHARYQHVGELAAALAPFARAAHAPVAVAPAPPNPNVPKVSTMASMQMPAPLPSPNVPTVSTMASKQMPAPLPVPAPLPPRAKSRSLLLGLVAFGIAGVGGLVGYLALAKSSPAKSAVVQQPEVAVPVEAVAPRVEVSERDASAQLAPLQESLLMLEGRISATPNISPEMPSLLMSATQMACAIGDVDKAKRYFARITDDRKRRTAIDACKAHDVAL